MKKNLLFIIPSLSAGGGEKSLINLLAQIDYDLYDVDLFLFNHEGIFMEYVPKEVNILPLPLSYAVFTQPIDKSLRRLMREKKYYLILSRLLFSLSIRMPRSKSSREQYSWKYMSRALDVMKKKYDVSIGYLEKTSIYFSVDKVNSKKKIGWIHTEYDKSGMSVRYDNQYFRKLDHIVTVSEKCATVLKNRFPNEVDKIKVVYNVLSPRVINSLANQDNVNSLISNNVINIVSIGRLDTLKGFDMAIDACKRLVNKGYNIAWNIIGEGEERLKLYQQVKEQKLEGNFKFLGLQPNPYPFIKHADIYVQTSRFEGKSIAIDEAKIMHKPIVITNYSTASDQISNNTNGMIVNMDPVSIADGIELLINNQELKERFASNLAKENLGTEQEIYKLYQML